MRQNLLEDELACASYTVDTAVVQDLMSAIAICADSGSDTETEDEEEAAMDVGSPAQSAGPLCAGVFYLLLFAAHCTFDVSHRM